MTLIPLGWYPEIVYRSFEEKKYVDQFIEEGCFRMGEIGIYTRIEDAIRHDATEGEAHIKTIDPVVSVHFPTDGSEPFETTSVGEKSSYASFGSNLIYILCCSLKKPNGKHGSYSIEINDPKALAKDISAYLETLSWKVFGGVEGVHIEYTKGAIRDKVPKGFDLVRLSYAQKPEESSDDEEFRFVTTQVNNKNREYIEINLGKRLGYVECI